MICLEGMMGSFAISMFRADDMCEFEVCRSCTRMQNERVREVKHFAMSHLIVVNTRTLGGVSRGAVCGLGLLIPKARTPNNPGRVKAVPSSKITLRTPKLTRNSHPQAPIPKIQSPFPSFHRPRFNSSSPLQRLNWLTGRGSHVQRLSRVGVSPVVGHCCGHRRVEYDFSV